LLFVVVGSIGPFVFSKDPEAINLATSLEPPVFAGGSWETTGPGGGVVVHSAGVYLLDAANLS
jgi:hypothetical protein